MKKKCNTCKNWCKPKQVPPNFEFTQIEDNKEYVFDKKDALEIYFLQKKHNLTYSKAINMLMSAKNRLG